MESYEDIIKRLWHAAEGGYVYGGINNDIIAILNYLSAETALLSEKDAEIVRLREALKFLEEASYQSHSGHWDSTMQHGAGCPECIRARELREKAKSALKGGKG